MAENTNEQQGNDPLEDAFEAPSAEGHPEAEGVSEDAVVEEESATAPEEASVEDSVDENEKLAAERLEDLRRLQAEFTNFKNRSAKEKEQLREFVMADFVSALLPVIDDIDAARQHGDLEDGPFAAIARKLEETLGKHGMERFGEVGEAFDPKIHEAVLQQPTSEVEPDHVSMVLRNGYKVKDRVVRSAQVAVATAE
ncbi:nucleotide exchange factor GrpE [Rothia amarae]|uniref:Protein GrpE n=1 Tax=Rothia amarae TaxID=169480 RepID=A0A7H2BIQ6_9MICC|nr:nucleotide exchange factor GrpE [Rothia amarae]QNV39552.1 nucleotide exchange factor GrpE [Rothia amarae]